MSHKVCGIALLLKGNNNGFEAKSGVDPNLRLA